MNPNNFNLKLYKITNRGENHNGYQYRDGLNTNINDFMYYGTCVPGGLYFTTAEHIHKYLEFGCWLRKIELPLDNPELKYVRDPSGNKWRSNMIILREKYPLYVMSTLELMLSANKGIITSDGKTCFSKTLILNFFENIKSHTLSDMIDLWENVYHNCNPNEIGLPMIYSVVCAIIKCSLDDNIHDNLHVLNKIYNGMYSNIIGKDKLLQIINACCEIGSDFLLISILKSVIDGEYTISPTLFTKCSKTKRYNFRSLVCGLLPSPFVEWCFKNYNVDDLIYIFDMCLEGKLLRYSGSSENPHVKDYELDDCYESISFNADDLKKIVLVINTDKYCINKSKILDNIIIYCMLKKYFDVIDFVDCQCGYFEMSHYSLCKILEIAGSHDNARELNFWFGKYGHQILLIDNEPFAKILACINNCDAINYWFATFPEKISSIRFTQKDIGKISCHGVNVIRWWLDASQKNISNFNMIYKSPSYNTKKTNNTNNAGINQEDSLIFRKSVGYM